MTHYTSVGARSAGRTLRSALVMLTLAAGSAAAQSAILQERVKFTARAKPGYKAQVDTLTVNGRAGLRYVIGKNGWDGWSNLPGAVIPSPN